MAKYKATGCARFLFFLIIFVPIAYFGSQYLMETGKWDQIREKIEDVSHDQKESSDTRISTSVDVSPEVKERLEMLLSKVNEQADKIEEQQEKIHRQNILIDQLKQRLEEGATANSEEAKTNSNTEDGKLSLEELLKEADKALKN